MASTAALYTPEVLGLATSLAQVPLKEGLDLKGSARSPACGSTIEIGLNVDDGGRISDLGIRAQACAIGQAAAALFATAALGRDRAALARALVALEGWLSTGGPLPDWPGLETIAAARDFPGRHGAMLLPWRAALDALPSGPEAR